MMAKRRLKRVSKGAHSSAECDSWLAVTQAVQACKKALGLADGEEPWFRGSKEKSLRLEPSLMWRTRKANREHELDDIEQDLFFEFQARARELHERGFSDWDFLFFMRHHEVPTRILDWTESLGVAAYFATLGASPSTAPCIWVLNPWRLNEKGRGVRDGIQPKYLYREWDYGELLIAPGAWPWTTPLAIYPLQIAERMRAQRSWFTIHGQSKEPLDAQVPQVVARIDLTPNAVREARQFLADAGLSEYQLFPDLDHLAMELTNRARL